MMKPFGWHNQTEPERIFNYILSRARRIEENAFGILGKRIQCLLTTLRQEPDTAQYSAGMHLSSQLDEDMVHGSPECCYGPGR